MSPMTSQITSLVIVYSTVYSDADQRKHQSFASLAFVREINRWPVNSSHKWPITRKMFPFDDVIILKSLGTHETTGTKQSIIKHCAYSHYSGIILCMSSANERRRFIVTSSLIGWAHTQTNPCMLHGGRLSYHCFTIQLIHVLGLRPRKWPILCRRHFQMYLL